MSHNESVTCSYRTAEQEMDITELDTHFRSLIAKQKETDSARCSASVMKMMSDKNVTTTQIYADHVNSKKRETTNKISLK